MTANLHFDIIRCFCLVICLFVCLCGASAAPSSKQKEARMEPLALEIFLDPSEHCIHSVILVKARLTNKSDRPVAVDARLLWSHINLRYTITEARGDLEGGSRISTGDPGPDDQGDFRILEPGQSLEDSTSYHTSDPIFRSAGVYTLNTTYTQFRAGFFCEVPAFIGSITSNTVEFHVQECKDEEMNQGKA